MSMCAVLVLFMKVVTVLVSHQLGSLYTVKTNLPFYQIIWLLQLHDCLSYTNLKNVVLVKHFVGG